MLPASLGRFICHMKSNHSNLRKQSYCSSISKKHYLQCDDFWFGCHVDIIILFCHVLLDKIWELPCFYTLSDVFSQQTTIASWYSACLLIPEKAVKVVFFQICSYYVLALYVRTRTPYWTAIARFARRNIRHHPFFFFFCARFLLSVSTLCLLFDHCLHADFLAYVIAEVSGSHRSACLCFWLCCPDFDWLSVGFHSQRDNYCESLILILVQLSKSV